jgi:hypothetical protein
MRGALPDGLESDGSSDTLSAIVCIRQNVE